MRSVVSCANARAVWVGADQPKPGRGRSPLLPASVHDSGTGRRKLMRTCGGAQKRGRVCLPARQQTRPPGRRSRHLHAGGSGRQGNRQTLDGIASGPINTTGIVVSLSGCVNAAMLAPGNDACGFQNHAPGPEDGTRWLACDMASADRRAGPRPRPPVVLAQGQAAPVRRRSCDDHRIRFAFASAPR